MKRPSFQFYPGDWQGNAKLRRCTHAERGIWIAVLCLMHDQEEYGILRWPLEDIAQAVGCKVSELSAIKRKGVLKGTDDFLTEAFVFVPRHAGKDGEPVILVPEQEGPVWYSSRMVRDEYIRQKRGEGTRFGDEPKDTPKSGIGEPKGVGYGDGPSSSSSSSSSTSTTKSKAEARATRLPADWILPDQWLDWAKRDRGWPDLTVHTVALQFKDHWLSEGGQRARKVDWFATWRKWCRNERSVQGVQTFGKTSQGIALLEQMKG